MRKLHGGSSRNKFPAYLTFSLMAMFILGITLGCWLVPTVTPHQLQAAPTNKAIPVSSEEFYDERSVALLPQVAQSPNIGWRGAGVITSLPIQVGVTVHSGQIMFRVNESPIPGLHTAVPLYRDLAPNTTGADVGALRDELIRLGYGGQTDQSLWNVFDWTLHEAVANWQKTIEVKQTGALTIDNVVWLPQAEVTFETINLCLGQESQTDIGSLHPSLDALELSHMDMSNPDQYELTLDSAEVGIPQDGVITDRKFLDQVQASRQFKAWLQVDDAQRAKGLDGTVRRIEAMQAYKVPAGVLYGVKGETGCIQSDGKSLKVKLLGSSNGFAMIQRTDGSSLSKVDSLASWSGTSSCQTEG